MATRMSEQRKMKKKLVEYFFRSGCFRSADPNKRKELGQTYKKGYEIRFVAYDENELAELKTLMESLGLKHGKTYAKSKTTVLPVYGKQQMERFREIIMSLSSSRK